MIFSSLIKKVYKKTVYRRYDERDNAFYFSHTDFDGVNRENFNFLNCNGEQLKGYFYYPDNEIDGRIVIFEHGMGSGHRSYMREIVMLVRHGYRVFTYDRTGCASSAGKSIMGLSASINDFDHAMRALKVHEKYGKYDFSVVGHSWGGLSTMNAPYYHPEISHIVAISGAISLTALLEQELSGFMKHYVADAYEVEREYNGDYVFANAEHSLKNSDVKALIIHSVDDPVVSFDMHFKKLREALSYKENIRFLEVDGKKHNPNYTRSAVKLLAEYGKSLKKNKKNLKTPEQRQAFVDSFDWHAITEQDEEVWNEIFLTLDN